MADNVGGRIISELGEIGKKVGGEVAKAPVDIAGKAMESLGATSGKTQGSTATAPKSSEQTAWEKVDTENDEKVKRAIARKALEELAGGTVRTKKQSVWEQLQKEQEQKKQASLLQAQAARASQLPQTPSKRPVGDLFGIKAKRQGSEIGKNVRQD